MMYVLILLLLWGVVMGVKPEVKDAAYFRYKQAHRAPPTRDTTCNCAGDKKQSWCCDGRWFPNKCAAACELGQQVDMQCRAGICGCRCDNSCDPRCCFGSVQYRNKCQMLCEQDEATANKRCRKGLCRAPNRSAFPISYTCNNLYA